MLTTKALGQVSQWTVGPVEHFLEADIDQVRKKKKGPDVVGMARGSQLPEDQAWTRSLLQQSWPPSQTGSVLLALESRGQGLSPDCTSALQDTISSVPVLHQVARTDPKACASQGESQKSQAQGFQGPPGPFWPMAREVGCWLRMSGLLLAKL